MTIIKTILRSKILFQWYITISTLGVQTLQCKLILSDNSERVL